MHRGYIKLWRKLRDNPMWLSEKFTRGQAWVDLLMLANHKKNMVSIRGIFVTLEPGQVLAGEQYLSERWQWSRGKVRRFMGYLASKTVQQIVQQKNNVCTVVTIVNWKDYQGNGTADSTTDGQQTDNRRTTDGHTEECIITTSTTKKAEQKSRFVPPTVEDVRAYCEKRNNQIDPEQFVNHYQSAGWVRKGGVKIKDWQAAVRTWEAYQRKGFSNGKPSRQHERKEFLFPDGEEVKHEV